MGYDQVAYLDIPDQIEISAYIAINELSGDKWEDSKRIGAEFGKKACSKDLGWFYQYNKSCKMHEIFSTHQSNFIRNDERFSNRRYQALLCKRLGKPEDAFPYCLTNICHGLHTREDALEIADALCEFFADDPSLMSFVEWLRNTAACCSTYELSF